MISVFVNLLACAIKTYHQRRQYLNLIKDGIFVLAEKDLFEVGQQQEEKKKSEITFNKKENPMIKSESIEIGDCNAKTKATFMIDWIFLSLQNVCTSKNCNHQFVFLADQQKIKRVASFFSEEETHIKSHLL